MNRSSELAFLALVALVAVERGVELVVSLRNARRVRERGGIVTESAGFYALMVATHAIFLIAGPLEVLVFDRPFVPGLGWPMAALVLGAMALRYWAVATLGPRWNTRVVVVPGDPVVTSGPYRYVRHPNYVAVIVEMFALPLVHTAWATAILFSALNAALLRNRIASEEAALGLHGDYDARFGHRNRFLPGKQAE